MEIIQKLKQFQKITGIPQSKIAKELKINRLTLRRWFSGAYSPRCNSIKSIEDLCSWLSEDSLTIPIEKLPF